jgi:Uma2 family endonuclease
MSTAERVTKPLAPGQRLTVKEFLRRWEAMPEVKFAELLEGVVYMPSPLQAEHGKTDAAVVCWLKTYAAYTRGCDTGSQATWLMLQSAPQPDSYLWIMPDYGGQSSRKGKYHSGAPELAAEVCLSSAAYDLGVKKLLYQEAGVQEYVAVLLKEKEVRWHRLRNGTYAVLPLPAKGVVHSEFFPGLWLDVPDLLDGNMARVLKTLERGLKSAEHADFVRELQNKKQRGS